MGDLPASPASWNDVVDLRDFYAAGLGQTASRMIRRRIRQFWPDLRGQRVLGLGFATPYLRPFLGEAERVLAMMPACQGVLPWPPEGPGLTFLADETDLPLPDRSMDRILLVHALESTEQARALLREVWRVLADGGRLIAVVPNRRGLWARFEHTPFGNGRPFSAGQLSRLMRGSLFTPVQVEGALFAPPAGSRMLLGSAAAIEEAGTRWFSGFGGVVVMEAAKQIYAGTPLKAMRTKGRAAYLPAAEGWSRDGTINVASPSSTMRPSTEQIVRNVTNLRS